MSEGRTESSAGPGRPAISDAQRSDMRAQIADAAMRLFQTEGYAKVSIRRIAGEIGCSPMTLYKYYDAKIDILRTLWGDVFDEVFAVLDALELDALTPAEKLQQLSVAYVGYWLAQPEHYRLVFMAEGVTQPDVSLFADDPDMAARYSLFTAAIHGALDHDPSPDEIKQRGDALICFLHGIAHNMITISGYAWSGADDMIRVAVRGVIRRD